MTIDIGNPTGASIPDKSHVKSRSSGPNVDVTKDTYSIKTDARIGRAMGKETSVEKFAAPQAIAKLRAS